MLFNAFHVYILVIFASMVMWGTVWAELATNDFALEACLRPTSWTPVPLEKLIFSQLVKKLQVFWENRRFTATITRSSCWSISWPRWIQPTLCPPTSFIHSFIHFNVAFPFMPRSSGRAQSSSLGAFAKLRTATVTFVMSVRPSFPKEQLGSHWTDCHEIWY